VTEYTPLGSEFLVNSTTVGDQIEPSITALADGGFVVTWTSSGQDGNWDIYAQRYDADGTAAGAEFRVNSTIASSQYFPSITKLADGGFVVSWTSYGQDGSDWGIYAQRYAADGTAAGVEFLVNSTTAGHQDDPSITGLADGGFVVSWMSNYQDGSGWGIYAQRYAADGTAAGAEFRVNSTTAGDQNSPSITALADGGFVVSWMSYFQDGDSWGAYAQRYAADGTAAGAEFRVNSTTASEQFELSVTALADGGFVVSWTSKYQDGSSFGIYAQRYAADGTAAGAEFRVNSTTASEQYASSITALADGGFVVSWMSNDQDGSSFGIYAQRYAADGTAAGAEFLVNSTTASTQEQPSVTALVGGGFVVSWHSYGQDGSGYGIYAQMYAPENQASVVTGDSTGDVTEDAVLNTATGDLDSTDPDGPDDSWTEVASPAVTANGYGTYTIDATGHWTYALDNANPAVNALSGAATLTDTFNALTADGTAQQVTITIHAASGGEVIGYQPEGGEFLVNSTTAGHQADPSITGLADGGFVVSWWSYGQDGSGAGIYAQRYAADGTAAGAEFQVNSTTALDQLSPSITALADGGFVVSWTSYGQDGSDWGVYAQRYAADGTAAGAEFQVNSATASEQYFPSITALADGGFVVSWLSYHQDGSYGGVYAQRYAADGTAAGAEFRVNSTTADEQQMPSITALADGGFVVSWMSLDQDGSGWGIYAQRYAADGLASGAEFQVNSTTASEQYSPSITALADGGFVVSWMAYGQDGSDWGIYAQRFAADGTAAGSEFQVNSNTASDQLYPSITALADGGFVVSWESYGQDGGDYGIYAQRYAADGTAAGAEFRVNSTTEPNQQSPSITALADGGFVVSWKSYGQDGDQSGIYAQMFAPQYAEPGDPAIAQNDAFTTDELTAVSGNLFADNGSGGDSDPDGPALSVAEVNGSAANVGTQITLASGALLTVNADGTFSYDPNGAFEYTPIAGSGASNTPSADSFTYTLTGGGSATVQLTISGVDNNDYVLGTANNDVLGGGLGSDTIFGGDGDDLLRGNDGNDELYGGLGNDILKGQNGDDLIDGGAGIDRAGYWHANAAAGGVTVSLQTQGTAQYVGSEGWDTLVSIENVFGTPFADILTGDDGNNWLSGSEATINDGNVSATNTDYLDGAGGDDLLSVGIGNHTVIGGSGTDTLWFTENGFPETGVTVSLASQGAQTTGNGSWTLTGIENLTGGVADDMLTGDDNANVLGGGSGNDTLIGGAGNDALYGDGGVAVDGNGVITTFVDVATIAGGGIGADVAMMPGVSGDDTLEGGLGDDLIDGGGGSDTAKYANASGGVNVNLGTGFASGADGNDTLTSIENAIGSEFNDTLNGSGGDNVLDGLGGNDDIRGQGGNDTIYGGDGNDTLRGDAANVTSLTVSGDDMIYGGDGNDLLYGGLGDDQLYGGANNDLLRGGGGVDYFDGGSDDGEGYNGIGDRISFLEQRATQGVIADLRTGIISNDGFGNVEMMVGIESFGADTAYVDTFYGDDNRNFLGGSLGDNLYGFGGDDALSMGAAAAVIDGGLGTDVLWLSSSGSWLTPDTNGDGLAEVAAGASAGWTVNLAAGTTVDGYGNSGSVTGIENVNGSHLGDNITGDANANVLNGVDGDDTLEGGLGDDTLDGGNGNDTVSYANASGSVTVTLTALGGSSSGADGNDNLTSLENVTGSGFNDMITGNDATNILVGGAGNDNLNGSGGDDTLVGGAGSDTLDGGAGVDTADYSASSAAVSVNLSSGNFSGGDASGDVVSNVENVLGSAFADKLIGNSVSNLLNGGEGNDIITGGGGADTMLGGGGSDNFIFKTVADIGGAGNSDWIMDFDAGGASAATRVDLIDLSAIDASTKSANKDDAFTFIGAAQFSNKAGQLRYDAATSTLSGDVNGDGIADFSLNIIVLGALDSSDFVL